MKNKKMLSTVFILMIGTVMAFTSCKKEAGPAGPQGAQGPQGLQGIPGPSGSTVLSGNGAPTATTGTNGDFYLDLATSLFYGPKSTAGWGTGFSMRGTTGAAGTNGNKIINGTTIPGVSDGNVGDYYLNTTNYLLYGPKTASGWGVGTSLIGSANVMYSGWSTPTDPFNTTFGFTKIRFARLNTTAITPTIINSGLVLVYARRTSNLISPGGTTPLPFTYDLSTPDNKASVYFSLGTSVIYINTTTTNNTFYTDDAIEYRYVIIPGGVALAAAKNINLNDLQAVENGFGIQK